MLYLRPECLGFLFLTVLEPFKKRNWVCFESSHSSCTAILNFQNQNVIIFWTYWYLKTHQLSQEHCFLPQIRRALFQIFSLRFWLLCLKTTSQTLHRKIVGGVFSLTFKRSCKHYHSQILALDIERFWVLVWVVFFINFFLPIGKPNTYHVFQLGGSNLNTELLRLWCNVLLHKGRYHIASPFGRCQNKAELKS